MHNSITLEYPIADINLFLKTSKFKSSLSSEFSGDISSVNHAFSAILDFAKNSNSLLYLGIKLYIGLLSMEDIEKEEKFIKKVDKWIIINIKNYYGILNTDLDNFDLPVFTLKSAIHNLNMNNPFYWLIDKKTMKPLWDSDHLKDYHKLVIQSLIDDGYSTTKKVKNFWNFIKRK